MKSYIIIIFFHLQRCSVDTVMGFLTLSHSNSIPNLRELREKIKHFPIMPLSLILYQNLVEINQIILLQAFRSSILLLNYPSQIQVAFNVCKGFIVVLPYTATYPFDENYVATADLEVHFHCSEISKH